jgi:hypothetical protein
MWHRLARLVPFCGFGSLGPADARTNLQVLGRRVVEPARVRAARVIAPPFSTSDNAISCTIRRFYK